MTVPSNLVPTSITQLPVAPNPTPTATMVCVIGGITYQVPFIDLQSPVSVPASREINTGGGLQGGGDLSQNRTLSIATGGVTSDKLAVSGATAGTYGSGTMIPVVTVSDKGLVTSVSETALVIAGYVPDTRQIIAGAGLTGGGNLQANRTISANFTTDLPLALGAASTGNDDNISRGDHVHPALNFANLTEYTGLLPLTRGGTGQNVSTLTPGAVWYTDGSNGFLQTIQGTTNQVLISQGSSAPIWGSALVVTPQAANVVYAGPTSGGSADPNFRALVNADIPSTLTGKTMSGALNTFSSIGNSSLVNSSMTINGVSISLGTSATITAAAPQALTIGTGLSGTSYDGSAPVTIAIDSTVATLTGVQTLTNKTINAAYNTFSNIPNSALTNSSLTIGTTNIALGGTSLTLGGLTSVTVTQDPTSDLQLATKQYVDNIAQGLDPKASCVYGTTGNITLSGLATQAGGDWASSLSGGERILVKNQTAPAENGIYAASSGGWTRTADMNTWSEVPSAFTFIEEGTTLADTGWVTTAGAGGTINVTAMPWVQFSGAGTYTAGTGLTLTGTQFSITNVGTAGTYGSASQVPVFVTNAQGQVSSVTNTSIAIAASQVTSGTFPIARGGTNSTATPTLGAISYGDGSAYQFSAVGTAGQVLTSTGSGAPTWSAGATSIGAPGYYGAFQDTTNQTAANTTTAYPIALGITDEANGVSITSGSRITVAHAGTYNLQYSIQFTNSNSQDGDINIWLRKNGSDIADSNSQFTVPSKHGGTNGALIAALNFVTTLAAGDYLQLYWSTTSTTISISTIAAQSGPPVVPLTPGVILTIVANPHIGLGYAGMTSTTSTTIGTGSKGFVVNTNSADSAFQVGTRVRISDQANTDNFMEGPITAYSGTSMTVNVQNYGGSGTIAAWSFSVAGIQGSNGVTYFSGGTTGLTPATPTIGSITLGGTLVIANGGTNSTDTPTAGAVAYGDGTKYTFSAAGTNGQFLISGGTGSPTWTDTIPGGTYA